MKKKNPLKFYDVFIFLGALLKYRKGQENIKYSQQSLTWLSVVGRP